MKIKKELITTKYNKNLYWVKIRKHILYSNGIQDFKIWNLREVQPNSRSKNFHQINHLYRKSAAWWMRINCQNQCLHNASVVKIVFSGNLILSLFHLIKYWTGSRPHQLKQQTETSKKDILTSSILCSPSYHLHPCHSKPGIYYKNQTQR